jgi:hypothetical protein
MTDQPKEEEPKFIISWKSTTKKSVIPAKYSEHLRKREGWKNLYWNDYNSRYEEPADIQLLDYSTA